MKNFEIKKNWFMFKRLSHKNVQVDLREIKINGRSRMMLGYISVIAEQKLQSKAFFDQFL